MQKKWMFLFSAALVAASPSLAFASNTLTIYTSRKEELLKPLLEDFTKQTGIQTTMLFDDGAKLIARIESEGKESPADVLMPADVATMEMAAEKGVLKPIASEVLSKNIPAEYRDSEGRWFGLGMRARVIIYNKAKVKPAQLSTYEALAGDAWKGQLLVRSSSHPYNLSLMAAMIEAGGAEKTESWVKGMMANLARAPQGGDTDQIKAIAAGEGSIAIANSYYYARMFTSTDPKIKEAAEKTGIFFPNQKAGKGELQGTHINLSGAGVVAGSKHSKEAQAFIEYLSGEAAQRVYADANQEYPVNAKVKPSAILQSFGTFKADTASLAALSKNTKDALKIADRSGWK